MKNNKKQIDLLRWLLSHSYFEYCDLFEVFISAGYSINDAKFAVRNILSNPLIRRCGRYYTIFKW